MNKPTLSPLAHMAAAPVPRGILPARSIPPRGLAFEAALFEPISAEQAERYIANPTYGGLREYGRKRMVISRLSDNSTIGYNRLGQVIPVPASVLAKLPVISESEFEDDGFILDGELLPGNVYEAFDLLKLGHEYENFAYRNTPMWERYRHLTSLLEGTGIKAAELATTREEKATLVREEAAHCGGGVVFKRLAAPVMPGRQGIDVKWKSCSSATLRVCSRKKQDGHASFAVEALEDGRWIRVGQVSQSNTWELPEIGSYREVSYLHLGAGDRIYQAEDLGPRTDVTDADCLFSQLTQKRLTERLTA